MASGVNQNTNKDTSLPKEFQSPKRVPGDVLRGEEDKLRAKYQLPSNWKGSGHSVFLQKQLAKGQKFFDSGDYQMAKQTTGLGVVNKIDKVVPQPHLKFGTGEAIPTPDTVPARKTSIIQPKFTPTT